MQTLSRLITPNFIANSGTNTSVIILIKTAIVNNIKPLFKFERLSLAHIPEIKINVTAIAGSAGDILLKRMRAVLKWKTSPAEKNR